ncbi:TetR/AcrR family transcriptional regulator [Polyangium mundeleinium]|uniref:TetR/AcrR family transcriptional regulator n=1 Tax=Polyangium mundeleinium TaxID=2995306 RepID=A0ABT5EHG2_9BACT|nr:TetR/AcrR family transcriptional regulator [Polyangium mundeleinium]MDC0741271.1 TetR/AcrR family transcriptional regulator [Polyangium mundeleinium]
MNDTARREQILQAADRLLRHYGPQKTTVADVAREAGVGVGTVYLEFTSKEAIVEELSRARYEVVLDAMRAAAAADGRSFGERLVGALDARLRAYFTQADGGAHACDLFHCGSPAVKSASERFYQEERALLADLLRRGTESGELDVADPDLTARVILRAYKSFTPPWIFMEERDEVGRLSAAMHAIVLGGVVARK